MLLDFEALLHTQTRAGAHEFRVINLTELLHFRRQVNGSRRE